MFNIKHTDYYQDWYDNLKDARAKVRIDLRLNSIRKGTFGKQRSVGNGVFELKIDYGQGYRLYYKKIEKIVLLLLCGGDKSTQSKDIDNAKKILKEYENENP